MSCILQIGIANCKELGFGRTIVNLSTHCPSDTNNSQLWIFFLLDSRGTFFHESERACTAEELFAYQMLDVRAFHVGMVHGPFAGFVFAAGQATLFQKALDTIGGEIGHRAELLDGVCALRRRGLGSIGGGRDGFGGNRRCRRRDELRGRHGGQLIRGYHPLAALLNAFYFPTFQPFGNGRWGNAGAFGKFLAGQHLLGGAHLYCTPFDLLWVGYRYSTTADHLKNR